MHTLPPAGVERFCLFREARGSGVASKHVVPTLASHSFTCGIFVGSMFPGLHGDHLTR